MKTGNKQTTVIRKTKKELVKGKMPHLDEEDLAWVREHERRQWAHKWMAGLVDGQVHWFGSDGIMMQKVDEATIRIISVTDHEWCYRGVAFMRATFEAVDVEVQLDPYTVIMPYVKPAEAHQAELSDDSPGVEVA